MKVSGMVASSSPASCRTLGEAGLWLGSPLPLSRQKWLSEALTWLSLEET